MTSFKDAHGRDWRLDLTIDGVDRINDIINADLPADAPRFDLLELTDAEGIFNIDAFRLMFASPRRMVAILAAAVKWGKDGEAEERALANGMRGDAIERAFQAFFDEVGYFFPESHRPYLQSALGTYGKVAKKQGETVARALAHMTEEQLKDTVSPEPVAS